MQRLALCVVVLVTISAKAMSSQSSGTPRAWGESVGGLRLGISSVKAARLTGAEFVVALQNTGSRRVVVKLGQVLGNGEMFSSEIRLRLVDALGFARELHFKSWRVAGWLGDVAVPLGAGAVYTFPVSLDQYLCESTREFALKLTPGRHRITARLDGDGQRTGDPRTQDATLPPYWTGTVQSGTFEFVASPY